MHCISSESQSLNKVVSSFSNMQILKNSVMIKFVVSRGSLEIINVPSVRIVSHRGDFLTDVSLSLQSSLFFCEALFVEPELCSVYGSLSAVFMVQRLKEENLDLSTAEIARKLGQMWQNMSGNSSHP